MAEETFTGLVVPSTGGGADDREAGARARSATPEGRDREQQRRRRERRERTRRTVRRPTGRPRSTPVGRDPTPHVAPALAIPEYDQLSASQVVERLDGLTPDELDAVRRLRARPPRSQHDPGQDHPAHLLDVRGSSPARHGRRPDAILDARRASCATSSCRCAAAACGRAPPRTRTHSRRRSARCSTATTRCVLVGTIDDVDRRVRRLQRRGAAGRDAARPDRRAVRHRRGAVGERGGGAARRSSWSGAAPRAASASTRSRSRATGRRRTSSRPPDSRPGHWSCTTSSSPERSARRIVARTFASRVVSTRTQMVKRFGAVALVLALAVDGRRSLDASLRRRPCPRARRSRARPARCSRTTTSGTRGSTSCRCTRAARRGSRR